MARRNFVVLGLAVLTFILIWAPVQAENRPIQIALVTPIQIFPEDDAIVGVRFNLLYGRNVSVSGLDLGLVNHTTTGMFKGWQHGLVGIADTDFLGWQDCAVNVTNGRCEGFQWGIVNYANAMSGFQLGLVNYAQTMNGLQIGFVNVIRQGGQFPVFPLVNWSF